MKSTKIKDPRQELTLYDAILENLSRAPEQIPFYDYDAGVGWSWKLLSNIYNNLSDKIIYHFKGTLKSTPVFFCTKQNILYPAVIISCWKNSLIPIPIHEDYTDFEFNYAKKLAGDNHPILLIDKDINSKKIKKLKSFTKKNLVIRANYENNPNAVPNGKPSPDMPALGLFTSGSSSLAKLIVFTHKNLMASAKNEILNDPLLKNKKIANLRPHFTSSGLNTLWPSILCENKNFFSEKLRKLPMGRFLTEFIEICMPDLLILSPTYIQNLIQNPIEKKLSPNPLTLYFGGTRLRPHVINELLSQNLIPVMRYGMTEVGHIISKLDSKHLSITNSQNNQSVGNTYQGISIQVKNQKLIFFGEGIADYELVNGKFVTIKKSGWFTSDDAGELSHTNEILLQGRDHKVLCINGFRFHSQQVEVALMASKTIRDCIVFIDEDQHNNSQSLIACCLCNSEAQTKELENTLIMTADQLLSPHKRPAKYIFFNSWPQTRNGKIDFNQLKSLSKIKYKSITND